MKPINVMHILCTGEYSGAESVAITIINSLKGKADSVYVSPSGIICDILAENGIPHYSVDKVSVVNIKKAIKDISPDIIHAHDHTAGTVCALAAGNIPVINHLHNNSLWTKKINIRSLIFGLSCLRFKKILTVSDSVMNDYILGRMFSKKSAVVGNPFDYCKVFDSAQTAEIKEYSDILFLGRLMEPKNPLMFIDIIFELKKTFKDIKGAIVGEGIMRPQVEKAIMEKGLENNIKMYGFLKNPYGMIKNAKVVCVPSVWEGFGYAALEGLALGKPVVAKNVGGLPNIVNNECGMICEKPAEFVNSLTALLKDDNLWKEKSKNAVVTAKKFDDIENYSKNILNSYIEVLNKN